MPFAALVRGVAALVPASVGVAYMAGDAPLAGGEYPEYRGSAGLVEGGAGVGAAPL